MEQRSGVIAPIEGLRAIAVLAVIGYHLFPNVVRGGYLGVDLFFVISGFVVTNLLARRIRVTGTLRLKDFYRSRVNRLVPALVALVVVVLLISAVIDPAANARVLKDLPYVFTGTYNWALSNVGVSYFDQWSPPLLQPLWSLAIEAQFYLIWPILFLALTRRFTGARISALLTVIAGAVMLWLTLSGPSGPSTVHFGYYFTTQLHVAGLLLGAALALVWTPGRLSGQVSATARWTIDSLTVAGLLLTLALLLGADESAAWTGNSQQLLALSAVLLLATAIHPLSRVGAMFTRNWLVKIGERSYSLYLWHWPIQQFIRPDSISEYLQVLTLTALAAEFSFRFVESYFRQPVQPKAGRAWLMTATATASAVAFSILPVLTNVSTSIPSAVADTPSVRPIQPSPPAPSVQSDPIEASQLAHRATAFVGDSLLLGLRPAVPEDYNVQVFDAKIGRQADEVLESLRALPSTLQEGVVIVNLGNNGILRHAQVKAICDELARFSAGIIINARVPRDWQDRNNELLQRVTARYPTVQLLNWNRVSVSEDDYLAGDRIHLTPTGGERLISEIDAILNPPS